MSDLLAAAFVAAGPGATDEQVGDQLIRLALMADPESPILKRLARIQGATRFVGDLVDVTIEASSTRAILTLRSDSADSDDGLEQIRTDRTDQAAGERVAALAFTLVGRRVLVFKVMEDIGPQKKVRICVHLVDIGPARSETPAAGPWLRRHWEEAAASAGVTPQRVLEAAQHYAKGTVFDIPDLDAIPENGIAVNVRRWLDKARASAERTAK